MSRELKFRAWHKENEEYINGHDVLLRCDGSAISRYALGALDTDMPVNAIIEQYTGLKDKNGKEIYEGDIVGTYEYYYNEETGEDEPGELEPWGVIVYEAPSFGLWGEPIYGGEDKHFFEATNGMVVIGNIHENPELLEDK